MKQCPRIKGAFSTGERTGLQCCKIERSRFKKEGLFQIEFFHLPPQTGTIDTQDLGGTNTNTPGKLENMADVVPLHIPEGTGLGLAVSFGIVREHGGVLLHDSPEHGGAEFLIRLPAASPA